MNYPGNPTQDCAAVAAKPDLEGKIKKTIKECVNDEILIRSADDEQIRFCIDGKIQFVDLLLLRLTDSEKETFLSEWVMDYRKNQAKRVCEFLTARCVNPLLDEVRDAASEILDKHYGYAAGLMHERELGLRSERAA